MEKRIKDTAEELFKCYGIKSITMDDIASKLGISKKTIYQFYHDKDELVEKITQDAFEKEFEKAELNFQNSENAIEELLLVSESMREMLGDVNSVLIYDLKKYYPKAWKNYLGFKNQCFEFAKRNLENGIKQKLFRPEINVDILAKIRVETVDMLFNHSIFPASKYNVLEIQLECFDHFLHGIVTPLGLELLEKRKLKNL